jgi:hypothetical protein
MFNNDIIVRIQASRGCGPELPSIALCRGLLENPRNLLPFTIIQKAESIP